MQIIPKILLIAIMISITQVVLSSVNVYRLPNDIIPISYKIQLTLNLENITFDFNGESEIYINVQKSTKTVIFYAGKNLRIKPNIGLNCTNYGTNINVSILKIERNNNKKEILELILDSELEKGTDCKLDLKYEGIGNNFHAGLYRTYLSSKYNNIRWVATTIFQPQLAHQVFPCWDEPAFKANFTISIKHNEKYIALSNMHEIKHEIDLQNSKTKITYFAESPKMSSNLVALSLGEYVSVGDTNEEFRIWVHHDFVEQTKYLMKIGPILLKALENYTNIFYKDHGFKKMDIVVLPSRSKLNGMENWGLINYPTKSVLVYEKHSSIAKKIHVMRILAHELAHQWFGNLVTAAWNNYLSLNEGFAKYFEYFIPNQIEPKWRMMDRFVWEVLQSKAFVSDSDKNSYAIEHTRATPLYLNNIYNPITFEKSASIIRMISFYLGEDKFKTAVRNYLKAKAFGSVTFEDLYDALVSVDSENTNLLDILKNWVTEPGYPVITVYRNYQNDTATITQSRFLNKIATISNKSYWVPINYVTGDNLNFADTNVTHWLSPTIKSITIENLKRNEFVIFNKQLFGFYRVNYDKKNWDLITKYLESEMYTNIHVLNRVQLIDDAFNLANFGYLDYKVFFKLIKYLKQEQDFIPWSAAWNAFNVMYKFIKNTEVDKKFKDYIVEISENLVDKVLSTQLNTSDSNTMVKMTDELKWPCFFGSKRCRLEATERVAKWLDNSIANPLSKMEKQWILCEGMREANLTVSKKFYEKYWSELDKDLLYARGCSSDIKILKEFLSDSMRKIDSFSNLLSTFDIIENKSENSVTAIFQFIVENHNAITHLMGFNHAHLQYYLKLLSNNIKSPVQLNELKQYVELHRSILSDIPDDALATAKNNLDKVDQRVNELLEFFTNDESDF